VTEARRKPWEARFAPILRQEASLAARDNDTATTAGYLAKAVTKIKYLRLKLRRRSRFDTLKYEKVVSDLGCSACPWDANSSSVEGGMVYRVPDPNPSTSVLRSLLLHWSLLWARLLPGGLLLRPVWLCLLSTSILALSVLAIPSLVLLLSRWFPDESLTTLASN